MLQMEIAIPAETQGFKNTGLLAWDFWWTMYYLVEYIIDLVKF